MPTLSQVNVLMLIVEFCLNKFMKIKVVIPCHLDSVRLEQKVLIDIHGLPMIEHVRRRALLSNKIESVFIATGDLEIKNIIEKFGGDVLYTKENHSNGTSRVSEAISSLDCTHIVLIQGDEPLLIPDYLDIFIDKMVKSKNEIMWNGISTIDDKESYEDTSIVKCKLNNNDNIISCFRKTTIDHINNNTKNNIYKIQGLIGYERNFLEEMVKQPDTKISKSESIEQMKAIEIGKKIKGILIPKSLPSVNTKEELGIVNKILETDTYQIKILNKIKNEFL